MSKYAENTTVSISQSRAEIERLLERYKATGFMYGTQGDKAAISFEMRERRMRFVLSLPPESNFRRTPARSIERSPTEAKKAYEQEIRRLWRGLVLIIKAKLEAVEAGVASFDEEFLSYTVMPNGQTVGEWLEPQLEQVYRTGNMPPLLPGVGQTHSQKMRIEEVS